MARTLKSTGIAANLVYLIAVDDDDTTIKEFKNGWTSGSGITLSGTSVTTALTWKSVTKPMITFGSSDYVRITTSTSQSTPLCFFYVVKNVTTGADGEALQIQSATAGGAPDPVQTGPIMVWNGSVDIVLREVSGGSALAQAARTYTTGEDFSVFLNEASSADNFNYFALEANTLSGVSYQRPDPSIDFSGVFLKQIQPLNSTLVMWGAFNTTIGESDAAQIHADPFGALFTADTVASTNPGVGSVSVSAIIPTTNLERIIGPIVGAIVLAVLSPFISNNKPEPILGAVSISGLRPIVNIITGPTLGAMQPAGLVLDGRVPDLLKFRTVSPTLPSATGDTSEDLIPTLVWQDTKDPATGLAVVGGRQPSLLLFSAPGEGVITPQDTVAPAIAVGQVPTITQINGNSTVLALAITVNFVETQGRAPDLVRTLPIEVGLGTVTLMGRLPLSSSPTIWIDVGNPQNPVWTVV
jgi:hypothetical protein